MNTTAPYKLERYKGRSTRYTCPSCKGKQAFARYVWTDGGEYIADEVGRCNRQDHCGYHLTPKDYWKDNSIDTPQRVTDYVPIEIEHKPRVNVPNDILESSLAGHDKNNFTRWLHTLFTESEVSELCDKYKIGTSSAYGGGSTIFWFINNRNEVRAGQIKQFDISGNTASYYSSAEDRHKKKTTWAHSQLLKHFEDKKLAIPQWLNDYIDQSDIKCSCLFGEHLLNTQENIKKPVALCEAPKTAIIASVYFPQYVWLAVGALDYLQAERVAALYDRDVYLFPDLNASDKWNDKAIEFSNIARFTVCDILEKIATEQEKAKGLDLADYLIRTPRKDETQSPGAAPYISLLERFKAEFLQVKELPICKQAEIYRQYKEYGLTATEAQTALNDLLNNYGFQIDNAPVVPNKNRNNKINN